MSDISNQLGGLLPSGVVRILAEMLSLLGHAGQSGRRPRILEGELAAPIAPDGTASVTIHGSDPVHNIKVDPSLIALNPLVGQALKIEAIQYDLFVRGLK